MKRQIRWFAALLLATLAQFASATVIIHGASGLYTACNGACRDPYSDFDRAQFFFTRQHVERITLGHIGAAYAHDHDTGALATLQVYDGVNWMTVFSAAPGKRMALAAMFARAIVIPGRDISGLRLSSSAPVGEMFHNVDYNMTYQLDQAAVRLPEPGGVALLCAGLAALVLLRRRAAARHPG
jgi:hypothetical protein